MIQVFFVMLFFPVVMNAMQYYIIDGFIKDQKPLEHEPVPSDDDGEDNENDEHRPIRRRSGEREHGDSLDEIDEIDGIKDAAEAKVSEDHTTIPERQEDPKGLDDYDPSLDGDARAESSSGTADDTKGSRKKGVKSVE